MVQMRDFLDPWTFDVKKAMKCCIGILQEDGRMIPFCTYNTIGYREEARGIAWPHDARGGTPIPVHRGDGLTASDDVATRPMAPSTT